MPDSSDFSARVRFVLVEPSHPGNVGAAARAIRAMGFSDLVLVRPRIRGAARHPEAIAFASGADDVLANCREMASLEESLADVTLAIALCARGREFGPAPASPAAAASGAIREIASDPAHRVALVFGCERTGLSIDDVLRCQGLACIPTDPAFRSLNLAQAVQIVAWELRRALLEGQASAEAGADRGKSPALDALAASPGTRRIRQAGRHATGEEIEALFSHLEQALVEVRFLDPAHPKKLMPRLRRLLSRTRLEIEEVDILRGVCTQMMMKARP